MSESKIPKAKYNGDVDLNGFKINCAVLDNGQRIFYERSLATAFGIKGSGAYWKKKKSENNESALLPEYLSAKYLKPFISKELEEKFTSALLYQTKSGETSRGFDVTILPDICDVYVTAKNNGIKNDNFLKVADNAYAMIKAFAKVGIIALVDEATGYQYEREKFELQAILQLFISEDIQGWQKVFNLGFYKEIFRLWNIPFTAENIRRKPMFIGRLTNDLIYKNMPKGTVILEKLKEKTPKTNAGNLKFRLHQSLTPEVGREELKKVINSIETLASISETKEQFKKLVERKYGGKNKQLSLNLTEMDDKTETGQVKSPTPFDKALKGLLSVPPPKK
jgi:hypothetical protein